MSEDDPSAGAAVVSLLQPVDSARVVAKTLEDRLATIATALQAGEPPSEADLVAVERLSRLCAAVSDSAVKRRTRRRSLLVVGGCALVLALLLLPRIGETHVEIEVKATNLRVQLADQRQALLVPGEWGEVIALTSATISRVAEVDPPSELQGDRVLLTSAEPLSPQATAAERAVRLQRLALPLKDSRMLFGISYGIGQRGLSLADESTHVITALFAKVLLANESTHMMTASFAKVVAVPVEADAPAPAVGGKPDQEPARQPPPPSYEYRFQSVKVSGSQMAVEIYPVDTAKPLTVLRNVKLASISFTTEGSVGSSVLKGTMAIADADPKTIEILPGDKLSVAGELFVRELTYLDDTLQLRLAAEASHISVGASDRNVMPTWFEFMRSRWPTHFYGSLLALVGFFFAIGRWWTSK